MFLLESASSRTPPQKLTPVLPRAQGSMVSPQLAAIITTPQLLAKLSQQSQAGMAADEDDLFELPPPVVDLDDEELNGTRAGMSSIKSEDDSDGGDVGSPKDDSLVRTPCGTRLVPASKVYTLDRDYTIWFQHAPQFAKKKAKSEEQYAEGLQSIGTFNSVQDFWRYWNAIDLSKMQNYCSLSVFKHPIKPMWEDDHNKYGGQWVIRCVDRNQTADYFTKFALSLIGGYFECHEDLCGVVLSMKPKFNSLSVWNCMVEPDQIAPVERELRELLSDNGDGSLVIEYKDHGGAMTTNAIKRKEVSEVVAQPMFSTLSAAPSLTAGAQLRPAWASVRTARPITTTVTTTTTATTASAVGGEAQPATQIVTVTKTGTSSTLKATAAPFNFGGTAGYSSGYNGYAASGATTEWTQSAGSNGNTYANWGSTDYAYYGTGDGTTYYTDQNAGGNEWA